VRKPYLKTADRPWVSTNTMSTVNSGTRCTKSAGPPMLLTSYRPSRSVLYVRTELGDALVLHSGIP
jgi:hypothetical protein